MASKYLIELILRTKKEGTAGKEIAKELDTVGKEAKKTGGMFKGLTQNWQSIIGLGAGVAGAAIAIKKALDMGREGAAIAQTAESFEYLMTKVNASAGLMDKLRDASRDTISDMDLMSATSTLLAGTQGELATQMANATPRLLEIAKAANKLNPSLGDTTHLYRSLAEGIKRSSPLILDNLGLTIKIGDANEAYAQSVGKTVEALSAEEKQMALLQAALSAGDVMIDQVGGSTEAATDSFDQLTAMTKNLTDQVKVALAPALSTAVEVLTTLVDAMGVDDVRKLAAEVAQSADSYEEYANAVLDAAVADHQLREKEADLYRAHLIQGQSLEELQDQYGKGVRVSTEFANSLGLLTEQQLYAQRITGGVSDAVEHWVEREREAEAAAHQLAVKVESYGAAMVASVFATEEGADALGDAAEQAKRAEAANDALARSVEAVRGAYEGFYGTLASGLVAMRELGDEQRESAADYESALADLEAKQAAVAGQVKRNWEAALPDATAVKERMGQAADAWDEWGLRIQDIIVNGVQSPWYAALQEMGMAKPPDTGVKEWAEQLKSEFYDGELPDLINKQSEAWQENSAAMKAAQADATAAYQQEVGARKAALQEEIDALNAARDAQLAAEQEARNRATTELALSLAEQTGMLEQWSQQRFGPDFSQIADSANEVLALLDSGMLQVDDSLRGVMESMTAGIQTALDTTGAQAEQTKAILDGIASTDWAAEKQQQLSQALDMQNLLDPESAAMAMEQVGVAIETGLPEEPFAMLTTGFQGATEAIITSAGEMDTSLAAAFQNINEESGSVAGAIISEWTGNSVFPDLIAGGADAESGITANFGNIGDAASDMAAVTVAAMNAAQEATSGVVGAANAAAAGLKKSASAARRFASEVKKLNAQLQTMSNLLRNMPTTEASPPPAATGLDMTSAAVLRLAEAVGNRLGPALTRGAEDASDLVSAAGKLSSIGTKFGKMYTEATLDPLQDQLDALDKQIEWYRKLDTNTALAEAARLEGERAELAEEYATQQEKILKLQEQQNRLDFLGEQVKLLKLIKDYELDPHSILSGLQLGAGVSTEAMIATTTTALERIASSLNMQLTGERYQHGGQFRVQGPGGIDNVPVFFRATAGETVTVTPAGQAAPAEGGGHPVVNVSMAPTIYNRMDMAEFEARVLGVVNQAIRM